MRQMPLRDRVAYAGLPVTIVLGVVGKTLPETKTIVVATLAVGLIVFLVWYFVFQRPEDAQQ